MKHFLCDSNEKKNTLESLVELEAVERLTRESGSNNIYRSPKLPLVSLQLDRKTGHVSCFKIYSSILVC